MEKNNWLANFFNNAGEVFEKFNPAAFRFLAAFLPYLTPFPVAWVSQANATKFLSLPPRISFVLVFGLEGIGLWFTALFVDSVVTAIRSKNLKAWITPALFFIAVSVYIVILVNINVIIEQSSGQTNPAYSRVITLMCFLPLITGIGNGYYKLILESKTNIEIAQQKESDKEDERWKIRENNKQQARLARLGINPLAPVVVQQTVDTMSEQRTRKASDYKEKIWKYLDEQNSKGKVLGVKDITEHFALPYEKAKGFVSTQRTLWARDRGVLLAKKGSTE